MELKKALFLDLDGTVRFSKGPKAPFIESVDDIVVYKEIPDILKKFKDEGWLIIAISNQGGVAHGFRSLMDVVNEMNRTSELTNELFDYFNFCVYDPKGSVAEYKLDTPSRKPGYGMLVEAAFYFKTVQNSNRCIIDFANSMMVGDRPEDQLCAKGANVKFCDAETFRSIPLDQHAVSWEIYQKQTKSLVRA